MSQRRPAAAVLVATQYHASAATFTNPVDEVPKANQQVQGVAKAADKIGTVIDLIQDIAEQTNLLALNVTLSYVGGLSLFGDLGDLRQYPATCRACSAG